MWFNSFSYIAFLPLVLLVYWSLRSWRARKVFILVASYFFYACWNPPFVLLLLLSSTIDYVVGRLLGSGYEPRTRKLLVALSCVVNFGILSIFKYSRFILESYRSVCYQLGLSWLPVIHTPDWLIHLLLPIGISFYTFHGVSYVVDVYRGKLQPVRSLVDFFVFVAFFPQLVAGPILRANYFLPQLAARRSVRSPDVARALFLITLGFFQKLVLADNIAPVANLVFDQYSTMSTAELWVGVWAFAFQIYFDFAGYSNIAIGSAALLGFSIPENFQLPYAAVGFRDFWRRWHISLSSWLRDYLYIPLGGSRNGRLATWRNLMIVMFLGGLWHGASWTFAAWGLLHGCYLVVEHALRSRFPHVTATTALQHLAYAFITFQLTCIAWVFFRATSIRDALSMLQMMFIPMGDWSRIELRLPEVVYVQIVAIVMIAAALAYRDRKVRLYERWYAPAAALMLIAIITGWGRANEFIYFRF